MVRVYVSLGSNIEREKHLRGGLSDLRAAFGALDLSPVYESSAVGFEGEPFLNLVAAFDTDQSIEAVDAELSRIEERHGRVRGGERFAPRTLDIDLLLFGDHVQRRPGLTVPRDEILVYAFVLKPLADLAGEERHPLEGRSYAELWAEFDDPSQVLRPAAVLEDQMDTERPPSTVIT